MTFRKRVRVKQYVRFQSRMTQILNVELSGFFKLAKHIFVVGASGSGKTSVLLLLAKLFFDNNETIIWRDDGSLEFLSLKEVIPCKVFIPEGCTLNYEDPNVEYFHYNPYKLTTLFNNLDRDKINGVVFDLFSYDMNVFLYFWTSFFFGLYKWKRTRIKKRVAFLTDEINDLAPGVRRGYIPRQLSLASNIYFSMKKFRKERVRLVASTHSYGDVHKPVREAFNFYLFKRMDSASVPDRFKRYDKVLEKLAVNELFIVDEAKKFNKIEVSEIVKPKTLSVSWTGDIKKVSEVKRKETEQWKKRAILGMAVLNREFGVSYETLADLFGYRNRSGVQQIVKQHVTDEDIANFKAIFDSSGK